MGHLHYVIAIMLILDAVDQRLLWVASIIRGSFCMLYLSLFEKEAHGDVGFVYPRRREIMDSVASKDCTERAALALLEKALRNKRPSSWKVHELRMYLELRGAKEIAKSKKSDLCQR